MHSKKHQVKLLDGTVEGIAAKMTTISSHGGYMRKIFFHTAIFVLVFSPFSCKDIGTEPVQLEFSDMASMGYFRVEQAGTAVFRSQTEWNAFVHVHLNQITAIPILLPKADFDKQMVIGVFWGGGFSGCANVSRSIESVRIVNNAVVVQVGPLKDLGECAVPVTPLHIVKIPKTDLPVVFVGNVLGGDKETRN